MSLAVVKIIGEKKLRLKNVVTKQCELKNNFIKEQSDFIQTLKKNNMIPVGPMIMMFSNHHNIKSLSIMVQINGIYKENCYINHFETFTSPKCLYVKFFGTIDELEYANKKIEVYAYENSIKFNGTEYMVVLNEDDSRLSIDIFKEIYLL